MKNLMSTVALACSLNLGNVHAQEATQTSECIIQTNDVSTLQHTVDAFIAQGIEPHEIAIACDMDETLVTTYLEIDGQSIDFPQS